jgi:hypothetical protein
MGKTIFYTRSDGYRIPEAHITISHFTVWVILTTVSFYDYDDDNDNDHDCHQETALPADKFQPHLSNCHFEQLPLNLVPVWFVILLVVLEVYLLACSPDIISNWFYI